MLANLANKEWPKTTGKSEAEYSNVRDSSE